MAHCSLLEYMAPALSILSQNTHGSKLKSLDTKGWD